MAEQDQGYRKKQAYLCVLVFVLLGVCMWSPSPIITVGAILAACGVCFYAATLEPEKEPEEHHH